MIERDRKIVFSQLSNCAAYDTKSPFKAYVSQEILNRHSLRHSHSADI